LTGFLCQYAQFNAHRNQIRLKESGLTYLTKLVTSMQYVG
jgi:hypothetical protein